MDVAALTNFKEVGAVTAVVIAFIVIHKMNSTDRLALVASMDKRIEDLVKGYTREIDILKDVISNLRVQITEAKDNGSRERDKLETRIQFITSDKITNFEKQFKEMSDKLDIMIK